MANFLLTFKGLSFQLVELNIQTYIGNKNKTILIIIINNFKLICTVQIEPTVECYSIPTLY